MAASIDEITPIAFGFSEFLQRLSLSGVGSGFSKQRASAHVSVEVVLPLTCAWLLVVRPEPGYIS